MKNKTPKNVTLESISESINDLALATAKGFESVDKRFGELETKLDKKIDNIERTLSGKIEGVDRRIDDLAFNRATKDEVYLLTKRIVRVESKVGIKSV